jgi:hypothetical protein
VERWRVHTDKTTRDGKLQVVGLGKESDDSAEDGLAHDLTLLVSGDDTRSDLNLVAQSQHTGQDGTTSNASLQIIDLGTGLVDVERSDNDHVRGSGEISHGDGDLVDQGLVDSVNVELELGRDRDNR